MSENDNKGPYVLTAQKRYKYIWVSEPDYRGIQWWAKQKEITLTAALHEIVGGFLAPRLAEVQREAVKDGIREGVFTPDVLKKRRRGFLNLRKR